MITTPEYDVIVVGAGFAGLYTVIHAARRRMSVLGIEAAEDVGGTWYWNRYPGARCDVESIDYSYSFDEDLQREWRWSERYATQPEILRYFNHVADRFDVRRHYRFSEHVNSASWDEGAQRWTVRTDRGLVASTPWLVMATGCLSAPVLPEIPGRDSFEGEVYTTSAWPKHEVDLRGKRVGIVGTGSTGIQIAPKIAEVAAEVVVYQRTANYSVPASNRMLGDEEWAREQANLAERRRISWNGPAGSPWSSHPVPFEQVDPAEREAIFAEAWERGGVLFAKAFQRQTIDLDINDAARDYFEARLSEKVNDPKVLADLTPQGHPIGTKRICTDYGYYQIFNEAHVTLVNLRRDPIQEITPTAIVTESGSRELDVIVYATGFDAMTGALTSIDIRGRDGRLLRDEWADGATNLVGVAIPGFPNLLSLNGPGTPSVLANMALTSEQQGEYALGLIAYCNEHGFTSAEARRDAAQAWADHCAESANTTLFGATASWYTGANIEGKVRGFLPYIGGFHTYAQHANAVARDDCRGFVLTFF